LSRPNEKGRKVLCSNRKARYDYQIIEVIEAGIVLVGSEVKSLRNGGASLVDSYGEIRDGEAFLVNANIAAYANASYNSHDTRRERKLLLHSRELRKLSRKVREKGLTLVPLSLYLRHGHVKVELALARGRRSYDKRDRIMKRDLDRAVDV